MHHIIIGGGIAGTTAAEELRKLDSHADITFISEEQHALYSRVLLPHYVKGKIPRERVFLKKESWYAEQKIDWITGETVLKVDVKNKHVELSSGREISYDKLLLASGGEVKLMENDLRGISYLRTLDDADHLVELLRSLKKDAHAGIYGGGFIAIEYLNIFAAFHIPTTIAYRGAHMWSRALSDEAGELIKNQLIRQGVRVIENALSIETQGEKNLEAIVVSQQSIPCDLLGVGIGVGPNLSFLKDSGIETQNGILTNQFLETSAQDVFAAGDVAEFYDVRYGRNLVLGNWMNAQMQGRCAAKNMVGERTVFDLVSSYAINILGLEVIFIGDTSRAHADDTRLVGRVEDGGITELFRRNNQLVGAILVGRNADRTVLTKMISEKADPDQFVRLS